MYNGSAPALNDVMGGRVPLMFNIWHSARRYVDTGQLKLRHCEEPKATKQSPPQTHEQAKRDCFAPLAMTHLGKGLAPCRNHSGRRIFPGRGEPP